MHCESEFNLQNLVHSYNADHIAITYKESDGSSIIVKYKNLVEFSDKVCKILGESAVPTNAFIGLQLSPRISFAPLILGILKYGAAFVYLDPERKTEVWNANLVEKLNIYWIFISGSHEHSADLEFCGEFIKLVNCKNSKKATAIKPTKVHNEFAFACQTSGTTGIPKIVKIPHASIVPNITYLRSKFAVCSNDVILQAAPPSFDPSVVEIFLALSSGATLLMIPGSVKSSPVQIAHVLSSDPRPTIIQATPSFISSLGLRRIQTLLLETKSVLRILALGGEQCPSITTLRKWKSEGNTTSIFNLYGVTEVSCWSTCHQVEFFKDSEIQEDQVCLGEPFPFTQLQVRNVQGCPITCGEGELFISNGSNMCHIEGESNDAEVMHKKWCATGDLVKISSNGNMYFLSRLSETRIIKRWGHKVSLSLIEAVVNKLTSIQVSFAFSNVTDTLQLVLYIVLECSPSDNYIPLIKQHLRTCLPSSALPDAIITLQSVPLTNHGKIDKRMLKSKAVEWEEQFKKKPKFSSDHQETIKIVSAAWLEALGQVNISEVEECASFLTCGGDSITAALLAADLLRWTGQLQENHLLTVILEGTFKDICNQLLKITRNSNVLATTASKKARLDLDIIHNEDIKGQEDRKLHKDPNVEDKWDIHIEVGHSHLWQEAVTDQPFSSTIQSFTKGNTINCNSVDSTNCESTISLKFEMYWKKGLGKCVDASPLILKCEKNTIFVVIGSHSGQVICVDAMNGTEVWKLHLGERIEASAVASECGKFIYIGCYDGKLYCIVLKTGAHCWAFQTGAMIKGSALTFQSTILVGSYDQSIYCLDSKNGNKLWSRDLCAGALLASPCLAGDLVLIGTLGGMRSSISAKSGVTMWSSLHSKPYFAAPAMIGKKYALFGAVDGLITCVNASDGTVKWSFQSQGDIFSSFAIKEIPKNDFLIFYGSSDCGVYCLNSSGKLVWKTCLEGRITSTPFLFQHKLSKENSENFLVICNAPNCVTVLNSNTGKNVIVKKLPKETFSSPVVTDNFVVLGCRDDYVYCFKLQTCSKN